MPTRRVVTGKDSTGKSVVISDGPSPREMFLEHTPGFASAPLWQTSNAPDLAQPLEDPIINMRSMLPVVGGASFMLITFPPDSVRQSPTFRPDLAGPEHLAASPGIAELFEKDNPGMHTTPTLDFVCVIQGKIVLELDDEKKIELRQGDTVVQGGARHAWRNPSEEPATIAVVLLGAKSA